MTMTVFLTGIALGVIVSVPPGPNSALCVSLATNGARKAVPVIVSAAVADAAYSLLAASGILLASRASADVLAWLTPCFLVATAILAWSPSSISTRTAAGVALLNPATVAIWLSLSSLPAIQVLSLSDLVMRPLPVALGTAAWFTLLAVATATFSRHVTPSATANLQRLLALSLVAMAAISVGTLAA